MPKVKKELERMETMGVIKRVQGPTERCAGMIVVPKPNGSVRICVDLTKLNQNVCRKCHMLPSVDHTLAQLNGATIFSKLDANSGFWQIKITKQSALLTTFITPFSRFCFNRLPFGIIFTPKHFQRRMSQILEGVEGVVCMMDDVSIYGCTQKEHDSCLIAVHDKIQASGATLNDQKCQFSETGITFLGHILDSTGIHPDPDKIQAIVDMKTPQDIGEVRRFLGMVHQMAKFSPQLAGKAKPLRELLSSKDQWSLTGAQQQVFEQIKHELSSHPVLTLYNPAADTVVAADASSFGLGAVLTQKQSDNQWRPIAYASSALSSAETRYAQIEKEAQAITYTCEQFQEYLTGRPFHIHTDHKPLVPILSTKSLDDLP